MTDIPRITTASEHAAAMKRLDAVMETDVDESEVEEYRALAQAIHDYEWERSWITYVQTDGADELEFMLDEGQTTLDELVPVFGGMEPLIMFMTRRRNLEPETLETLVSELGIKREYLDKPFCSPEGWQDITMENSTCCDEDPCPMGIGEWRERLLAYREEFTGIHRIGQDKGAGVTPA